LRHSSRPAPFRATIGGTRIDRDRAEPHDEARVFPNLEGRYLEEFPPAGRIRPAGDRDHEMPAWQRHDCLWQRLDRVAVDAEQFDRRVSFRGLPDTSRKRPAIAQ